MLLRTSVSHVRAGRTVGLLHTVSGAAWLVPLRVSAGAVSQRRFASQSSANLLRYVEDELQAFKEEGVQEECQFVIDEFLRQSGYAKRTSEGNIVLEKQVGGEEISVVIPQQDDGPSDDYDGEDDYGEEGESDNVEQDIEADQREEQRDDADSEAEDHDDADEEGDEFFVTISKKDGNALSVQCVAYGDGFDVEAVAVRKKEDTDSFFNARRYLEDHEVDVFKQYIQDKTGLTDGFSDVVASLLDAEHEKDTVNWLHGIKEFLQ